MTGTGQVVFMAKTLSAEIKEAHGVELNNAFHEYAMQWKARVSKESFETNKLLCQVLDATNFHGGDMLLSFEEVQTADVIFANNALFDEIQGDGSSINGKLAELLTNHMIKPGACVVTTLPLTGRRHQYVYKDHGVPHEEDDELYKIDAFTFPNRSFQRTGQASAWNGYITRLRPSLQKAHNMHIISISIHAVQMAP
jgi:hypothetical protein